MSDPQEFRLKSLEREQLKKLSERARLPFSVFIAGPFINPDQALPRKKKNGANSGVRARYRVFRYLRDHLGIETLIGEHEELVNAGKELFKEYDNAALTELTFVKDGIDSVILLPCSPGSFCEFGLFSRYNSICDKMLIIIDKQFQADESYINFGPVKMAGDKNASIHFIDYEDEDKLKEEVEKFVTRLHSRKLAKRIESSD